MRNAQQRTFPGHLSALLLLLCAFGAAADQASIRWTRPDANYDGSAVSDLKGFKVYHGIAPGNYADTYDVGDVTQATISNLVPSAAHYFAVTAYNRSGTESPFSAELKWTAPVPHTVALTRPADGAAFTAPATVSLEAAVTANGHAIARVDFVNSRTVLGSDTSAPYAATWTNPPAGTWLLNAVAYDSAGSAASSSVVRITIGAAGPPPPTTNRPPSFTGHPITGPAAIPGTPYSGSLLSYATDPDSDDTLAFSKIAGPGWLDVLSSGTLSGTPAPDDAGTSTFTVRVADAGGLHDDATLQIAVGTVPPDSTNSLPPPWQQTDVGAVAAAGSALNDNGVFTIKGSGKDILKTDDEFTYVYQTMSGDGEIIARVRSIDASNSLAKAGIMIREDLTGSSPYAFACLTRDNQIRYQKRLKAGACATKTKVTAYKQPNNWLRLVRKGNYIYSYRSRDGVNWSRIESRSTMPLTATVYVGLAVTSREDGALATAVFDKVTVLP